MRALSTQLAADFRWPLVQFVPRHAQSVIHHHQEVSDNDGVINGVAAVIRQIRHRVISTNACLESTILIYVRSIRELG